jgi:glycosyltransferase involved in cell wall biosynthesis
MKVLVFPEDGNPYQALLYGAMPKSINISYIKAPKHNPLEILFYTPVSLFFLLKNRPSSRLLHIHWMYPFSLPPKVPFSKRIAYFNSCIFLYSAKLLGYKIVWTVHNVLPHASLTSNDLKVRRQLSRISIAKIVHSKSSILEMKRLGINTENCQIIPHGNYKAVYQNNISKAGARQSLHIPLQAKVVVFFGRIETYKNIPELLAAYQEIAKEIQDVYLIVAGECPDLKLRQLLENASAASKGRLLFEGHFIDNNDIQIFFNAADICVFPFKEITTSGSVLLAATFGKPVVVPYLGALKDIPQEVGYFYDPSKKDALKNSISALLHDTRRRKEMAAASLRYTKTLSWDKIAKQTLKVYQSITD